MSTEMEITVIQMIMKSCVTNQRKGKGMKDLNSHEKPQMKQEYRVIHERGNFTKNK